jgi:hypothetical protein
MVPREQAGKHIPSIFAKFLVAVSQSFIPKSFCALQILRSIWWEAFLIEQNFPIRIGANIHCGVIY